MDDLLSPMHIVVLLIVALLIFGPKRLPEIGGNLAKSIKEFKRAMNGDAPPNASTAVNTQSADPQKPPATPPQD